MKDHINNKGEVYAQTSNSPSALLANIQLLIVDDDIHLAESTRRLLSAYSQQITVVHSGHHATQKVAQQRFDLVLLDLNLPNIGGLDILAVLRKKQPDCLVIVISGDDHIDSAIQALRLGAHDFLRKPCEPQLLIKTVLNACLQRKLQKENEGLTRKIRRSAEWHRFLVHISPDIIYTLDGQNKFTFISTAVRTILGYEPKQLVGHPFQRIVHDDDTEMVNSLLSRHPVSNLELRLKAYDALPRDGETPPAHEIHAELSAVGMYQPPGDSTGRHVGTYGVLRNISERKRAEATIAYQAYHDLLTGLPNRTLFKDRIGQVIAQAKREGQRLAVLFLDLDRFKTVNDTYGHAVGDQLLQAVAQRLRNCLREVDTLCRLGGDEFILLLPNVKSRESVRVIAEKIIATVSQPYPIDEHELSVGVSIGIALFPEDGSGSDFLCKHADIAMYHAKDAGGNNLSFFRREMRQLITSRVSMENDLRRAAGLGQFEVNYQPMVAIGSNHITGMEALLRWRHPGRGLVPPAHFIPLAEESGLMHPINEWVLNSVCQQARQWQDATLLNGNIAINLSARQIEHPQFVNMFARNIEAHGIRGDRLAIEITESHLSRDLDGTVGRLQQLANMGVKVAIDDFGSGYSSLAYLRKLPLHSIKVDRSFIQEELAHPAHGSQLMAGIAAMAKSLNLECIAKGVETSHQLDYIRDIGYDTFQGFFYSPPVPANSASTLLQQHLH
jgi:diguanylate cyclase (GGDEF)-like protein/PAS domain S-box-containing protein